MSGSVIFTVLNVAGSRDLREISGCHLIFRATSGDRFDRFVAGIAEDMPLIEGDRTCEVWHADSAPLDPTTTHHPVSVVVVSRYLV
jgi:hypothetical protein